MCNSGIIVYFCNHITLNRFGMNCVGFLVSLILFSLPTVDDESIENVLTRVDKAIEQRESYGVAKQQRIDELKSQLSGSDQFGTFNRIFNQYKYYQYDSAYVYARKLEKLAESSGKRIDAAIAQSALLFCYKSVGFFNEATDIIDHFRPEGLPDRLLSDFYLLCAQTYQNLSSYVSGTAELSTEYDQRKMYYYDLALKHAADYSFEYSSIALDIALVQHYSDRLAIDERKSLIAQYDLDEHEQAVQYSILSAAYNSLGRNDEAIYYRALSALNDIQSSTHETTSAKVLAEYMYQRDDIARAYKYIHQALFDAEFYNSRLRMVEINTILPVIENSRYNWINRQRVLYLIFGSTVLALLVLTFILLGRLRKRNLELSDVHRKLLAGAEELSQTNLSLLELNAKLKETNEIKDRYIIQSLYGNSSFVNEVEKLSKAVIRKIGAKQYDDARALLYNLNIKEERERIYASFDTAFLKLFPNFLEAFNALFPSSDWVELDSSGVLPMEVRIFALMRLGIDNPSQVADYLNLSVNTVYVYKANVKAKTILPKEQFDAAVMGIPKP